MTGVLPEPLHCPPHPPQSLLCPLPASAGHLPLLANFEPVFSTPAASMAWCPNGSEASQPQGHVWEGAQISREKQHVLEIWSPHSSGCLTRPDAGTVSMQTLPDVPPEAISTQVAESLYGT